MDFTDSFLHWKKKYIKKKQKVYIEYYKCIYLGLNSFIQVE